MGLLQPFADLGWQAWFTGSVVILMIVALVREWYGTDVIMGAALTVLMGAGILTPREALVGFGNPGMLTVAALFIVAAGVRETGGLFYVATHILGKHKGPVRSLLRLMLPTTAVSAFLNNTPVVAMFTPVVRRWANNNNIAPSKLLIPLSYASILGGICTLIGTSTNLVVSGMMHDHGMEPLGMFEISKVGIPVAVCGLTFMVLIGRRFLPDRRDVMEKLSEKRREFLVEMKVRPDCRLIGKSIEDAGLRHLRGLFLVHIERDGRTIGPVNPTEVLAAEDILLFTGLVDTIVELKSIRGLEPITDSDIDLAASARIGDLRLFEVVISASSPLAGTGVREAGFRNRYDAAVIAVHRLGHRVVSKIGDIVLRPGDTLLLEAPETFDRKWYNSTHFYLVSQVGGGHRVRHDKAPFAAAIVGLMVLLPALGLAPMVLCAFGAAGIFVVTHLVSPVVARRSLDLGVLVTIAAAFGIGRAMETSGLAPAIAALAIDIFSDFGTIGILTCIFVITSIFTELITNTAAAALVFPIALSAAEQIAVDPRPFVIGVAIAASSSFATPLGYQTNLIVYGPGGYRFSDFFRIGIFMNLLVVVTGVTVSWLYWFSS